ncbi:PE family protein [Nocardia vinacea]|uniref:PE family protein n=1 Tax=Nocardia vinacea TaxID=96468 RepID=A0ABZ1Z0K7_9NOCA|nr:PE family protein [Nocardia vinacea]
MEFDPIRVHAAAADLDALADWLSTDLRETMPTLAVAPTGADEVSGRAADTLRLVAQSYHESAAGSIDELRKLASVLRSQSERLTSMEQDNAAGFSPLGQAG